MVGSVLQSICPLGNAGVTAQIRGAGAVKATFREGRQARNFEPRREHKCASDIPPQMSASLSALRP